MIARIALLVLGLLTTACATVRPASQAPVPAAWVELGPGGAAQARVITESAECPALIVDGAARAMQVRAAADGGSFPVTVCEAPLPAGARLAAVGGQALALPVAAPRRVLVIGDTGCRMKAGDAFQACNDPVAWPFATIAARAAAWRPDLVIHVGDYHYRESPCPAGNTGCAGSPVGDTWASWLADFFGPAAPLLRAAPWIVVRGNHESCSRAGNGWFRFLDPRPLPPACTDTSAPYVIPLGGAVLGMLDSSAASDSSAPPADVARYAAELEQLAAMTPPYTWLVTHRPLWGMANIAEPGQPQHLVTGNATLQAAVQRRLPAPVALLLAGHVHLFEALAFEPRRPSMLLVGNSGSGLDTPITGSVVGMAVDGATITTGKIFHGFGWVTMEPVGEQWRAMIYDVDGRVLTECAVRPGTLTCAP